jgi:hypothetical protein
MSDTELQALRDYILCATARFPKGITTRVLEISVASAGFELDAKGPNAMPAQLKYLREKNLLQQVKKSHTPSEEMHELTSDGDDYLRDKKLI